MKNILLAATLLSATPAFALQTPVPGRADPRVCDVNYDANNVTDVVSIMGDTVSIRFGPKERITNVTPSDTAHLKFFITEGSNMLWLKGTLAMPPQPISIRTMTEDNAPRDYALRWTALPDTKTNRDVSLAAANGVGVTEVFPDKTANICYLIRYSYPVEVSAAQAAAWRRRKAKEAAEANEIALRTEGERGHNMHYVAQGDASIGPTEIFDDGYTTTLRFPGNMRIPVILKRTPEGTDSEVTGTTAEQGGIIKIHSVLPFIRLRDGDLVLCIWNRGYTAIGDNPGTGTTAPDIDRGIHTQ
jgi:type IV secretion system protein VirB9